MVSWLIEKRLETWACVLRSQFEQKPGQTSGVFDVDWKLGGDRRGLERYSWGVNEATNYGLKNQTSYLRTWSS